MALTFTRSWADEDLDRWRDTCSRFVEQELQPGDEAARQLGNVGKDLWRKAGELGLLCTDIPETWGGGGGDFRHEAVIYEECSRRGLSGWGNSVHTIVAHYFLNHGTEEQRQRYLPRMARGEIVGAIAMTEPGTGSDLQGIRTRAEKQGDHFVINGSKTFITNGLLAGLMTAAESSGQDWSAPPRTTALGALLTLRGLATSIAQLPAGFVVDRFGAKTVLMGGLLLRSMGSAARGL